MVEVEVAGDVQLVLATVLFEEAELFDTWIDCGIVALLQEADVDLTLYDDVVDSISTHHLVLNFCQSFEQWTKLSSCS